MWCWYECVFVVEQLAIKPPAKHTHTHTHIYLSFNLRYPQRLNPRRKVKAYHLFKINDLIYYDKSSHLFVAGEWSFAVLLQQTSAAVAVDVVVVVNTLNVQFHKI